MRLRFPLWAKILVWLGLNLAVLALGVMVVLRGQFPIGMGPLLLGIAGDRLQAVSELLVSDLGQTPRSDWSAVVERFGQAHQVVFALLRNDGRVLAGDVADIPKEVRARVVERRGPPIGPGRGAGRPVPHDGEGGGGRDGPRHALGARPPFPGLTATAAYPKVMVRTTDPAQYWVLVHVFLPDIDGVRPAPATLALVSPSIRFGGLLLDPGPWIGTVMGGLFVSMLVWLPLVWGITRSIRQMTKATGAIAEGQFDVRIPDRRGDELGILAGSINRLASQLGSFVTGQKRFLGDIAHELCSPLARIQMVSGILEARVDASHQDHVADLREDVQQMSSLVNELLAFSKAGWQGQAVRLETVPLADVVRRAVEREAAEGAVEVRVPQHLAVRAEPELLARAVANVVRNARRYAGEAGPIVVSAQESGERVCLRVTDGGPGVPAEAVGQLFTPFYRPDPARSRETGGVGLGLAIVKTCIEACGGTVTCRNLDPRGFEVEMLLSVRNQG